MRVNVPRLLGLSLLALLPLVASAQMPYRTSEEGMAPKKRELWYYGMRSYPFGRIPQSARQEAIAKSRVGMLPFAKRSGGLAGMKSWMQIGPASVGGRVNSVAVHPTDGHTLWIGAADGGIWKSTNRGESWRPVMDDQNSIALGAIAVATSNPNILYAGTGEQTSNVDAYAGAGIMKSTDGGESWSAIGLTNVGAFSRIAVDPTDDKIVLAGGTKNNGGLYRSTDGGKTWTRTMSTNISDISVNPKNPREVWVGTWSTGIFHSTDGGVTFAASSKGLGQDGTTVNRVSVQCAPSNPAMLYALVHETNGQTNYSYVYRSTNSGANWSLSYDSKANFMAEQGWYNNVIAVKPDDPNTVLAGGTDMIISTDGGRGWGYIDSYAGALHPDQHAMAWDPSTPNRLYIGNDGGVYISEDAGHEYEPINSGLAISQFYAMAIDQSHAARTYGGTQDNGTLTTASTSYGDVFSGDGFYVGVDQEDPTTIYAENYNGTLYRLTMDAGKTVGTERIGFDFDDDAAWSAPILMHPTDAKTVLQGRKAAWISYDGGESFERLTPSFNGLVSALGVSPKDPRMMYVGTDRGELVVSSDAGGSWTDVSNGHGLPNRAITDFAPSAKNGQNVYVTTSGFYSGHVFASTDGGQSWRDISGGLPDIPANAIALHPEDENIIYVGTDIGMFITTDGGGSWSTYNEGLPRVSVADLEVHKTSKTLRMASHGRSMWEIPLEKPTFTPTITSPIGGEVWTVGTGRPVGWAGFDGAVKLELSTDDGASWAPMISSASGTSLRWIVNGAPTMFARIRATSVASPGTSAVSRSFAIEPYKEGTVLSATTKPGIPYGLAFDGEYLWATDFGSNTLLKLDRTTLTSLAEVKLDAVIGDSLFTDITYNPTRGTLFLHKLSRTDGDYVPGYLFEVSKEGKMINRWPSPCNYPIGLAYIDGQLAGGPYLMATERNGDQNIFFLDPDNPGSQPLFSFSRKYKVRYGPRGLAYGRDGKSFFQVITDFTGETLQSAEAREIELTEEQAQSCVLPLVSPTSNGYLSARGVEFDPQDRNLWISDYSGNIYKIASCDGAPPIPAAVPGTAAAPAVADGAHAWPNPFGATTEISFTLAHAGRASVAIYAADGHLVEMVADREFPAGTNRLRYAPEELPSGAYRCVVTPADGAPLSGMLIHVR